MNFRALTFALILTGLASSFISAQGKRDSQSMSSLCRGKSTSSPKPALDWPPMTTKRGGLISDCPPMNMETIFAPPLRYPKAALAVRASGMVSVEVVTDKKGRVIWADVVDGHPLLRSAALDVACKTRFKPAKDCLGRKLRMNTIIHYNFKL